MLRFGVMLWCCVMLWHVLVLRANTDKNLTIFGHPAFGKKMKKKTCYALSGVVLCYVLICYAML